MPTKEYYQKHKKEVYATVRKWIRNNREQSRENEKRRYYKDKHKCLVRVKTRQRYGKLPYGFVYHHTTEPYNINYWIGVHKSEHHSIFG